MLPGLERMGLVVPLGGTTLFFRRRALEAIGGWDAWNVTEDADLGLRLARHGWRTEMLPSTTLRGGDGAAGALGAAALALDQGLCADLGDAYARIRGRCWRRLGWRRMLGVQVLFFGTVAQALLAPLLWSFWLLLFGLPHPLAPLMGQPGCWALLALFLAAEAANLAAGYVALRPTRHRGTRPLPAAAASLLTGC